MGFRVAVGLAITPNPLMAAWTVKDSTPTLEIAMKMPVLLQLTEGSVIGAAGVGALRAVEEGNKEGAGNVTIPHLPTEEATVRGMPPRHRGVIWSLVLDSASGRKPISMGKL